MELIAVRNARFIAAITTEEINPRGLVIYPSLIAGLVEKYDFDTYPSGDDELDETKGISFENGNWNGILISKITIFSDGIVTDTRSSNRDSETVFEEAMTWASESLGLTYKPEMVLRRIYLSEIILRSETPLNYLNSALQSFAEKLSNSISKYRNLKLNYALNGISFYCDDSDVKSPPSAFRIERLDNAPHSTNKYYSVAPLPTDEHLEFLKELEAILSKT